MNEICIRRLSEDGLTTHEYNFKIIPWSFTLQCSSYFVYHRDDDGIFSYENPRFTSKKMTYEEWCSVNNHEYFTSDDDDDIFPDEYLEYANYRNPTLWKTKYGKPLMSGIHASIKNIPECPKDVAEEALELARKKLVVKYE